MPRVTAICYISSLLFYGMGYLKMSILKNADVNTYDFTINVSLATTYFVLTIFLVGIGTLFFYVRTIKDQDIIMTNNLEYRIKAGRGSSKRRRASTLEVKAQLSQTKYSVDLERRMSS
ncbi:MAG: hypothetical protein Q8912_06685 [Bacillota bacterium]|nr:hypothetical protein [Bacillota bacterium]